MFRILRVLQREVGQQRLTLSTLPASAAREYQTWASSAFLRTPIPYCPPFTRSHASTHTHTHTKKHSRNQGSRNKLGRCMSVNTAAADTQTCWCFNAPLYNLSRTACRMLEERSKERKGGKCKLVAGVQGKRERGSVCAHALGGRAGETW